MSEGLKGRKVIVIDIFDPAFGARPLKRVILNEVQNELAMKLLNGDIKEGSKIIIDTGPEFRSLVFKVE